MSAGRHRFATLALVFILSACGAVPGSSPATGSPGVGGSPLRDGEFGPATIDATLEVLAASGIGVYETTDATAPVREIVGPASPVTLLIDQVEAMALEAHAGGGIEGAEIDALFDVPSDLAPPSYILAGYVAAVDTPGARLARSLMGVEDWTAEDWRLAAPALNYPKLVMTLFTSDVAREREAAREAAVVPDPAMQVAAIGDVVPPHGIGPIVPAADGPCSAVLGFVSSALKTVFDALRPGESSNAVVRVLSTIWTFVVDVLEVVITTLVKTFEQKVLDWIGRVAAIVGTVSTVIAWVQPWTATVAAAPTEKGITGIRESDQGQVIARVFLPAGWDWPKWAADCASASGRDLPNMRPEGTPVNWEPLVQTPPDLVLPAAGETKLDAQGGARLPFTTLTDAVQNPYSKVPGQFVARVTFERQSLKEFSQFLQKELWKELPSFVVGALQAFLQPHLDKIDARLGHLISVAASGPAVVIYHVQEATPPPSPPPTPPDPTDNGDFCNRYRAYVAWGKSLPPDTDMTQELALEIVERFKGMWPVTPPELRDAVALVWRIYLTFAKLPEPANLPATGFVNGIQDLPYALMLMHDYCGIPWP